VETSKKKNIPHPNCAIEAEWHTKSASGNYNAMLIASTEKCELIHFQRHTEDSPFAVFVVGFENKAVRASVDAVHRK